MKHWEWIVLVGKLRALLPQVLGGLQRPHFQRHISNVYVGDEFVGRGTYIQIFGGDPQILQAQLAYLEGGALIGMMSDGDGPVFFEAGITIVRAARWVIDQLCKDMEDSVAEEWMAMLNLEEPAKT